MEAQAAKLRREAEPKPEPEKNPEGQWGGNDDEEEESEEEAAAEAVRPFIANGTVVGIFYGDEISCTCNVPFWAVDAATAYFR